MKTILLGLFHINKFSEEREKYGWDTYPFEQVTGDMWLDCHGILDIVSMACSRAEQIIFLLDDLIPKHEYKKNKNSYTTEELDFILKHPSLIDKTIFKKNDIQIDSDEVIRVYGCKGIALKYCEDGVVNSSECSDNKGKLILNSGEQGKFIPGIPGYLEFISIPRQLLISFNKYIQNKRDLIEMSIVGLAGYIARKVDIHLSSTEECEKAK